MAELDVSRFYTRLGKLHGAFLKHRTGPWREATCLVLNRGQLNDEDPYLKSVVLHHYLFGYELPDTALLLTQSGKCFVLATKKKCEFLESAVDKAPEGSSITGLTLLRRNKSDNNAENFNIMLKEADLAANGENGNGSKKKVGVLSKEWSASINNGAILSGWQKTLDEAGNVELVDVSPGIGLVLAVKDDVELDLMRKSSVLSNKVLKHGCIPRIEEVIDSEQTVTHELVSTEIEGIIEDPSKIKLKVPKEHVQSCYFPIVQSGGEYDIRISAQSTGKTLKYDIITVSLGARYQLYCSNIARTFLVDPPKAVSQTYETLVSMQEACLKAMVPGRPLKGVYLAAVKHLKREEREDLVKRLPKSLGFSIGLDFREPGLVLGAKNPAIFRQGMVFNLSVGFTDVNLSESARASCNSKSAVKSIAKFGMVISDMVSITDRSPDVLTKHSKGLTDISYVINEDQNVSSEEDEAPNDAPSGDAELARKLSRSAENMSGNRASARLAQSRVSNQEVAEGAAERQRRQIQLMSRRNEERLRELARSNRNKGKDEEAERAEELETYKRTKDYPDNVLPNQVKVDMANKCVILPICGNPVPYHISMIKNVVLPEADGTTTYLRINFYTAGMALGKDAPRNTAKLVQRYAPYASFIREMTFRSLEPHNLTQAYRQIQELRKRERQKELREQEEANLVKQEKLIRTKNERVPRLSDLTMRPVFASRKTQGNLEAHTNGMRFISTRGEVVDVMYGNIKHAIYQPCENEIMVLIHFHLRNPIMLGKKKQKDIQFFTEVIDASQAVDGARRSMYDPDEMDDEQRERMLRRRLNEAFKEFCRKVETVGKKNNYSLEFDIPYRDLGFPGNPHKEMVFITPTLNCLVNLTETPFFVVDLSDVDHVHFERVTFASKAFDIVIVPKDFAKQPWRVDMVPNDNKDAIQEWLTDMELSYTEGPMNLNWKQIMQTVASDDRFYMNTEEDEVTEKEAGWEFLRMYGNDADEESGDDSEDSEFDDNVQGESSEGDSEEDESEFDSEEEDESDFDADEDLEEQGMDWDEMERQAASDDRRRGRRQEEDDGGGDGRNSRRGSAPSGGMGKRGSSSRGSAPSGGRGKRGSSSQRGGGGGHRGRVQKKRRR